jgi:type IV secretory pathway TraG/TraD family ATPase VirD4
MFPDTKNFIDVIMIIMSTPPAKLIKEIADSGYVDALIYVNNFITVVEDKDGTCTIVVEDSKFLTGVCQELTNKLSIFVTEPRLRRTLIPSDKQMRWEDMDTHNIFISVPQDRLEQYSPLLAMMITQAIRTLERRPDKHDPAGANQNHVLVMLDEAPRLGKIEVLESALSTLRSKNVEIALAVQSIKQLDAIYSENVRSVILDNCSHKAILRATDATTQDYLSKIVGTKTTIKNSYTLAGPQLSEATEPRVRPHEFATLKDMILITPKGYQRVKKKLYFEPETENRFDRFIAKVRSGIAYAVAKAKEAFGFLRAKAKEAIKFFGAIVKALAA